MKPNAFRVHPFSYAKDIGSTSAVTLTWPSHLCRPSSDVQNAWTPFFHACLWRGTEVQRQLYR